MNNYMGLSLNQFFDIFRIYYINAAKMFGYDGFCAQVPINRFFSCYIFHCLLYFRLWNIDIGRFAILYVLVFLYHKSPYLMELIVACDPTGIIGDGNTLLWRVPEDSKMFREMTTNHIVVMGRKTYDSLPIRPLPNRINVILSRICEPIIDESLNIYIANYHDIRRILRELMTKYPTKRIFIIGGSEIYNLFFYNCTKFHITIVRGADISPNTGVVFDYLDDLRENTNGQGEYVCTYQGDVQESRVKPYTYQYFTYTRDKHYLREYTRV